MTDAQKSLAAYYALVLRSAGYSPQAAARAVVRRYPGTRAELEARGLLTTRQQLLDRWTSRELAEEMESEDREYVRNSVPVRHPGEQPRTADDVPEVQGRVNGGVGNAS